MLMDSPIHQQPWTRRLPPVIDTVLLASAIILTIKINQYPFVESWLTAKVIALILYIGFGVVALHYGKTKPMRILCWLIALCLVTYIVMVAITKNPFPLVVL